MRRPPSVFVPFSVAVLALFVALTGACSPTPSQPTSLLADSQGNSGSSRGLASPTPTATPTDAVATIQATAPSASEAGPIAGGFTVSLSYYSSEPITVNYTVSGTATAGSDYAALPGSVTIPAGQTGAGIPVTPIDDATQETSETAAVGSRSRARMNFKLPPTPAYNL